MSRDNNVRRLIDSIPEPRVVRGKKHLRLLQRSEHRSMIEKRLEGQLTQLLGRKPGKQSWLLICAKDDRVKRILDRAERLFMAKEYLACDRQLRQLNQPLRRHHDPKVSRRRFDRAVLLEQLDEHQEVDLQEHCSRATPPRRTREKMWKRLLKALQLPRGDKSIEGKLEELQVAYFTGRYDECQRLLWTLRC